MATPNYSYEKRQRELAKKRKKEDKAARKANPGAYPDEPVDGAPDATTDPARGGDNASSADPAT
jgi:hypothetical protein